MKNMFNIDYYRISDGVKVTAKFASYRAAAQWAKDTGRPAARIYADDK